MSLHFCSLLGNEMHNFGTDEKAIVRIYEFDMNELRDQTKMFSFTTLLTILNDDARHFRITKRLSPFHAKYMSMLEF